MGMDGPQETRREYEGFVSLHDHLTSGIRALRELVNSKMDSHEKAGVSMGMDTWFLVVVVAAFGAMVWWLLRKRKA